MNILLSSFNFYFNPRSREGSDGNSIGMSNYNINFNPRSREGSDLNTELGRKIARISIHAPARGATPYFFAISTHLLYFNPRSREGSDKI